MNLPMRLLAIHCLRLQLWPQSALLSDGFLQESPTPIASRRSSLAPESSILGLHLDDGERISSYPTSPEDHIGAKSLLSQAYKTLTVKQLRDLLRQNGAKLSGNKRELVDRIGKQMSQTGNPTSSLPQGSNLATDLNSAAKRRLWANCNNMTLKELKDILRKHGSKVSGKKQELVHRLMILPYENHDWLQSQTVTHKDAETDEWFALHPSITVGTTGGSERRGYSAFDIELPFLSGLLFVSKPPGWSTLPTKQSLDNPLSSEYPCLSDSVKSWLDNDVEGQQILRRAIEEEEKLWPYILKSTVGNPKLRKKMERIRDKQKAKMSTFEPRPVHRIDIDTSGIVCIALTPHALRSASMLFERKSQCSSDVARILNRDSSGDIGVQKSYVALVEGTLGSENASAEGVVEHPIGQVWVDDHNEWACDIYGNGTSPFIRPGGDCTEFVPQSLRESKTSYNAVNWTSMKTEHGEINITRVELMPHTGRGHQLRLHMASLGHPIVGDEMHGELERDPLPSLSANRIRLCLHASEMNLKAWIPRDGDVETNDFQICQVTIESCPPF